MLAKGRSSLAGGNCMRTKGHPRTPVAGSQLHRQVDMEVGPVAEALTRDEHHFDLFLASLGATSSTHPLPRGVS